jgi:hypothetical protein
MCLTPMTIRREAKGVDGSITRVVGCGRCVPCLRKKQIDWCFRLGKELKSSSSACFLTLTYDDKNVPISEGGYSLARSDFQKFMKRLRKHANQKQKIKYYACGEYGDPSKTERPHYHAIVFNLPRPFDKYIKKAWKLGHIHIGTVTEQSIFYTTKYALKGLRRKKAFEYDELGREPEFQLMSNGLGESYNKHIIRDYLITNGTKLLTLEGGHKKKLPRYYIDKMFNDPIEKAQWAGEAYRELSSHHGNDDIDDKKRRELIEKHEYRNQKTIKKGNKI